MSLVKTKKRKKSPLKALRDKAWSLCSKCIRLEASDHRGVAECYTCGTVKPWQEQQAGHAIDGRNGAVLFDEEIIRVQCVACNIMKHGNHKVFAMKLIQERGLEWYEAKIAGSHQTVKRTRSDYEEMIESYQSRLREVGV